MKLFEKIKIRLKNGKSTQFRICDIPVLQISEAKGKKKIILPFFNKHEINKNTPVFYLKVNSQADYLFLCLQHWIKVIDSIGADYYILCDNKKIERNILKKIIFPNSNIKFIKSCRGKELKKYVDRIATKYWKKAAYAHLTTFLHAKKNNIHSFWNIDADDTTFLVKPERCVQILNTVEIYAKENNIDAFSFDMWNSRTKNIHWSFGITYTQMNKDWFKIFEDNYKLKWNEKYSSYLAEWNVDFFFTHLRDAKAAKIGHFYVDNLMFIHWGDFLFNIIGSSICQFKNGNIIYPIIFNIFKNESVGIITISPEGVKFDLGVTEDECIKFALNFSILKKILPPTQKLWGIESMCSELEIEDGYAD